MPALNWHDHRAPLIAALALVSSLAAPVAGAQSGVAGQITILEQAGARTTDLSNAVVWLEPAAGTRSGAPTKSQTVMESRLFVPRVRVVSAGSTVEFPNQDPFRHNVFSKSGPSEFDLGLYGRGESKGARFERTGVYPIFCNIHAKMLAFVVVVPTANVTQAGADGRFVIADVPAGRYTLHAWHDRAGGGGGTATQEIVVASGALTEANVKLDARRYQYVQHKNKFGQEYTQGRDRY